MIVDTSVIVCVLTFEPETEYYVDFLNGKNLKKRISAANYLEAAIVLQKRSGPRGLEFLDSLLDKYRIKTVPVSHKQAKIASRAYLEYGKGNHPAKLNYGDCFAYALAKELEEPLLFKGTDFQLTDIEVADFEQ